MSLADTQEFKRKAALVEVEWIEEMNKRGLDGKLLRDSARALIEKHSHATQAPNKGAKPAKG